MATVINTTFKFKRGMSSRWAELNPVLSQGEPGFEIDTGKLKIGNGINTWAELQYVGEESTGGIISVNTKDSLPEVGDLSLVYRVIDDKLLYQWNNDINQYEPLNMIDDIQINVNDIV